MPQQRGCPTQIASIRIQRDDRMNQKQPAPEIARTAEPTTTRLRVDGHALNARPELDAASAQRELTPAARAATAASSASGSSGPGVPPNPNHASSPPSPSPTPAPTPWIAEPKTWLGVVITCLLGALPIVTLVLVRKPGSAPEVLPRSTEVFETAAAPPQVIGVSAPAAALPEAAIEAAPEVLAAPLEPGVARAAGVPSACSNSAPTLRSPPTPRRTPAVSSPAPSRTSWFHR